MPNFGGQNIANTEEPLFNPWFLIEGHLRGYHQCNHMPL